MPHVEIFCGANMKLVLVLSLASCASAAYKLNKTSHAGARNVTASNQQVDDFEFYFRLVEALGKFCHVISNVLSNV